MSPGPEPEDVRLRFGMDPPRLEEQRHYEELVPGADERIVDGRWKLIEKVAEWGPHGWQCPVCHGESNSYGHGHEGCRKRAA